MRCLGLFPLRGVACTKKQLNDFRSVNAEAQLFSSLSRCVFLTPSTKKKGETCMPEGLNLFKKNNDFLPFYASYEK